jgi:hypothetical protein
VREVSQRDLIGDLQDVDGHQRRISSTIPIEMDPAKHPTRPNGMPNLWLPPICSSPRPSRLSLPPARTMVTRCTSNIHSLLPLTDLGPNCLTTTPRLMSFYPHEVEPKITTLPADRLTTYLINSEASRLSLHPYSITHKLKTKRITSCLIRLHRTISLLTVTPHLG